MKKLIITIVSLCVSYGNLNAASGEKGNGGGGFYVNGKYVTLGSIGLSKKEDNSIFKLYPRDKFFDEVSEELDRVSKILPLTTGERQGFFSDHLGEYIPSFKEKILSKNDTFIDVKIDNIKKFNSIKREYVNWIETNYKVPSGINVNDFQIYAVSDATHTYLLPAFYKLSSKQKALNLIHEKHVRNRHKKISETIKYIKELKNNRRYVGYNTRKEELEKQEKILAKIKSDDLFSYLLDNDFALATYLDSNKPMAERLNALFHLTFTTYDFEALPNFSTGNSFYGNFKALSWDRLFLPPFGAKVVTNLERYIRGFNIINPNNPFSFDWIIKDSKILDVFDHQVSNKKSFVKQSEIIVNSGLIVNRSLLVRNYKKIGESFAQELTQLTPSGQFDLKFKAFAQHNKAQNRCLHGKPKLDESYRDIAYLGEAYKFCENNKPGIYFHALEMSPLIDSCVLPGNCKTYSSQWELDLALKRTNDYICENTIEVSKSKMDPQNLKEDYDFGVHLISCERDIDENTSARIIGIIK